MGFQQKPKDSDFLQHDDVNLASAADLSTIVITEFAEIRSSEEFFQNIEGQAAQMCPKWNIPHSKSNRKRNILDWLKTSIVTDYRLSRTSMNDTSDLSTSVFPVFDCMVLEMNRRFSEENYDLMKRMQSLQPESSKSMDMNTCMHVHSIHFGKVFKCDVDYIRQEIPQLLRLVQPKTNEKKIGNLKELE